MRAEWNRLLNAAETPAKMLLRNKGFQYLSLVALMLVLYLPDFWIVANVSSNIGLDIILSICILLFLLEIFIQLLGRGEVGDLHPTAR